MASNVKPASKSQASLLNAVGYKSLLTFTILALAWIVGFASRLFAVIRFESIIHEFDPWYVSTYKKKNMFCRIMLLYTSLRPIQLIMFAE